MKWLALLQLEDRLKRGSSPVQRWSTCPGMDLCSCMPGSVGFGWEFVLLQFLEGFSFQPLWKNIQALS